LNGLLKTFFYGRGIAIGREAPDELPALHRISHKKVFSYPNIKIKSGLNVNRLRTVEKMQVFSTGVTPEVVMDYPNIWSIKIGLINGELQLKTHYRLFPQELCILNNSQLKKQASGYFKTVRLFFCYFDYECTISRTPAACYAR